MKKLLNGIEVEMTELEIQQLEQSRIVAWSREAHIAEINALHSAEYDRRWSALGYEDRTEVATAMANPNCGYQQEAISLNNYWWAGWNAIEDYAETVTEETAQDPIVFISSI